MSRPLQMLVFLLVFSTIIAGFHYYIWHRLVKSAGLSPGWKQALTIAIVVLGASIPFTMLVTRNLGPAAMRVLSWLPMVWLGMMMLFVFALLAVDVVKLVHFGLQKLGAAEIEQSDPERRDFINRLVAGSVGALVMGLSGAAAANAGRRPVVIRKKVNLSKFPAALDGLTIVQISDIHMGLTITRAWLEGVVGQVNALKADVVVITGDLVDGAYEKLAKEIAPLGDLKARLGVFFVTGNHEYFYDYKNWLAGIGELGIEVLENRSARIGDGDAHFMLAGVNDPQGARVEEKCGPDVSLALEGRGTGEEVVLLSHQPLLIDEAAQNDVGLVLSGHTHGGQIWPFNYFVGLQQPYNRGFFRHTERTSIYVNQGTGLWGPPMRLGTTPEITRIELSRG